MTNKSFDVVVVGAGLLGSSVAMHLAALKVGSVLVVDLDLEGAFSSSELNAGGVRATWDHPLNTLISKLSIEYYASVQDQVGFRQNGYFWMHSKDHWAQAVKALKANPCLEGMGLEFLSPTEITKRFAFIDKVEDLGGATFSPKDGLLNPNLLKMHYRQNASRDGVRFLNRAWVDSVRVHPSGGVEIEARRWPDHMSEDDLKSLLVGEGIKTPFEHLKLKSSALVNCSGPWAKRFAKAMGTTSPSEAVRRQVSIFECKEVDLTPYGMFVDSSGVYFHSEANSILGGYAVPDEPRGYNFEYEGESFFEQCIWPALFERSSKFEGLKHVTGWAGLYEVSPDRNGIVGRVPGYQDIYEAHSFSGRGAMQSYAAGLGLAELIAKGRFESLDLSELSSSRFAAGKSVVEKMLI